MLFRLFLLLALLGGLTPLVSAQGGRATDDCKDRVQQHVKILNQHLDLTPDQMDCIREKASKFCQQYVATPPKTAEQKQQRRQTYRRALLSCLDEKQRERVRRAKRPAGKRDGGTAGRALKPRPQSGSAIYRDSLFHGILGPLSAPLKKNRP